MSMFLMPRFPALRRALGADAGIRVLTCDNFDAGLLVPVPGGFLESGRPHFARLTRRGRRNPAARRCLDFFDALSRSASEP